MSAVQGSPEWLQERLGFVTASRFSEAMSTGRSKTKVWGDAAISYALALAGERLTNRVIGGFTSAATEWGNNHEAEAVALYELMQGVEVETVGFVQHALLDWIGASPDGLIGDDTTLEVKCPMTEREHLRAVWDNCMPSEHKPQVQGGLWVTGRKWCHFVSYHPDLPESCSFFMTRVERDPEYIAKLADRIEAFAALVSEMEDSFRGNK